MTDPKTAKTELTKLQQKRREDEARMEREENAEQAFRDMQKSSGAATMRQEQAKLDASMRKGNNAKF